MCEDADPPPAEEQEEPPVEGKSEEFTPEHQGLTYDPFNFCYKRPDEEAEIIYYLP